MLSESLRAVDNHEYQAAAWPSTAQQTAEYVEGWNDQKSVEFFQLSVCTINIKAKWTKGMKYLLTVAY